MVKLGKFFETGINGNIEVGEEVLSPPLCGQDSPGVHGGVWGPPAVCSDSGEPKGTGKQNGPS